MFDITCVGILTADMLAKPIEELPHKGLLSKIEQLKLGVGGCAANAAIDLAKLGASVQLFGKIGQDNLGVFVKSEMLKEGVNVDGLRSSKTMQTSGSVVAVSKDGERSVMHCVGANGEFCFEDISIEQVRQSKILLVAGAFLMPGFDGQGTKKLLQKAQQGGVLSCLDTAWDSSGEWMNKLGVCLPYLDWFMPSYEEAAQLSGKTNPVEIVRVFESMGVKNNIVKLGSDGCFVKPFQKEGFFVKAYGSLEVVDTSGAGDSFCAGFLMGLLKGWDSKKCAEFANAVGCFCVASLGTTSGIKSYEQIQAFIKAQT